MHPELAKLVTDHDPDFIVLTETKLEEKGLVKQNWQTHCMNISYTAAAKRTPTTLDKGSEQAQQASPLQCTKN